MSHVVIIGCGVVGAAIAYELSKFPLKVSVLDRQLPAQGSTGAALGVLMSVISHKVKGNAWLLRQASLQRYETLIPELEALTGRQIPFNRQGIFQLFPRLLPGDTGEGTADWEQLVEIRRSQGWQLEIWDSAQVRAMCPHLIGDRAVYSPQDRQVEPTALTLAMVEAAQHNGATFHFGVTVDRYIANTSNDRRCQQIQAHSVEATGESLLMKDVDWLVIAAGLGSMQSLPGIESWADGKPVLIRPVLGQALHLRLSHPLGHPDFQPVVTRDDVHIVPVGGGDYWVGATVEFPTQEDAVAAAPEKLEEVRQQAIAFCPNLAQATIVRTWSGLRPRPEQRPAPVIGHLQGLSNVLIATGHYRNGVLLAPATAQTIREMILPGFQPASS